VLDWWLFNSDIYSTERSIDEVSDIISWNQNKLVDLRPYMIEHPYTVSTTDKLIKCIELFRYFHLRSLPVIDPVDGSCVVVLTRGDLFAYMSL
jgi:CBS domain-containing protein